LNDRTLIQWGRNTGGLMGIGPGTSDLIYSSPFTNPNISDLSQTSIGTD